MTVKLAAKTRALIAAPSAAVRFAAEAAFLILVALGAGLAQLRPLAIAVVMLVAWLLVAFVERSSSREAVRPPAPGDEAVATPAPEGGPGLPEPAEEAEQRRIEWRWPRISRREAEAREVSATVESAPPPVRRVPLEPALAGARPARDSSPAEPAAELPEAPEEKPPKRPPEVTVSEKSARALLAAAQPPEPEPAPEPKLEPKPAPEPPAEPEPVPELPTPEHAAAAEGVVELPRREEPPREWNLWDLEHHAREHQGAPRQEEWAALFMYLREFANADGLLPIEFDALVRESFADLIEPAWAP